MHDRTWDRIRRVDARMILDSRGHPTVEAQVTLEGGAVGLASVPSGASTGRYEAVEKRDEADDRYLGRGVCGALQNIRAVIAPALRGMRADEQQSIDRRMCELDGTGDKSHLGANAILAVSLANAQAAAKAAGMPLYRFLGGTGMNRLPVPMMNILGGGVHAAGGPDTQEFMILPVGAASFSEAVRAGSEIYHQLGRLLLAKGLSTAVGDEGGYAPAIEEDAQAIELILEAIRKAGYAPGLDVKLAIDGAVSGWYRDGAYHRPKRGDTLDREALADHWKRLVSAYPIASLEDPMGEEDWTGWQQLTAALGSTVRLVGDDLFVTCRARLEQGIAAGAANAILIKPNQVGTLSETIETVRAAERAGYTPILSHRSGETEDSTIADLAVALGVGLIKAGAPCRGERTAKYNRLLRIEGALGGQAVYAGAEALAG